LKKFGPAGMADFIGTCQAFRNRIILASSARSNGS